jgi:exodeoxyribonuclease VII small subunit
MAKSPSTPAEAAAEPSSIAQFEQSLDELEQLVARMEGGELSLDESLRSFERGIALFRNCQNALEQAELRVKLLLDPNDPDSAAPFEADE